ncbi:hypothetical protein D3C87_1945090 [compost metagenome]
MVMVLFGSAVPVIWVPAGLRVIAGWPGATVSTIKLMACDKPLGFPAASISRTVTECGPSESGPFGATLHKPFVPTVTLPTSTPLS